MSINVEFYFDFGSPTAYLAHKRLQQLKDQYDFTVDYRPVLLGGIFKASENQSPVANPAKGAYMLTHDLPRFALRYSVPLMFNPHFPINTLTLMRGAFAAAEQGCFEAYVDNMYDAMWQEELNMADLAVVHARLEKSGLDAAKLTALTQETHIKAALIASTEEAVARGAFGAPTMFIGDEMFFGQDRIDFIEERLQAAAA